LSPNEVIALLQGELQWYSVGLDILKDVKRT